MKNIKSIGGDTPAISVVMSVFNGIEYVDKSIESILIQTFNDFEFIIINDGSTDNTLNVIKYYANIDERIVVVDQDNKGLTNSLIIGCNLAKGKYIARQDADDISKPERLMHQVSYFEEYNNTSVVGTCYHVFYDSGVNFIKCPVGSDVFLKRSMFLSNPFCHSSVMFSKGKYHDVGGYRSKYKTTQDLDLWFRLSKVGKFGMIKNVLVNRNIVSGSMSLSKKAYLQNYNSSMIRLNNVRSVNGIPVATAIAYTFTGAIYHLMMTILPESMSNILSTCIRKYSAS